MDISGIPKAMFNLQNPWMIMLSWLIVCPIIFPQSGDSNRWMNTN